MERVQDNARGKKLPYPMHVEAILGPSADHGDEADSPKARAGEGDLVAVKIELVEQSVHPKAVCLVPNCGRRFGINVNEGQVMFRFPAQNQAQSRVWIEILGLKNPGDLSSWTMDDDYFVCGLHFAGGVCSKVIGHPSFMPTRLPPGVQPHNVVIMPPLDPQTVLSAADFYQPMATSAVKRAINSEFESDSEIDEPHAEVPIPPNRNEKCEPLAMAKWSQLPTEGDIIRAVIATLTRNEASTSIASIVEQIFQLWTKVKCPPIPVTAISTRVRNLMTSVSGLKSTDILGARKSEFAGLFNVACPAQERTSTFNYEFYRDQLSARQMYFSSIGEIHKPDQSPDQVKTEVMELKDTPLPTWIQLPTSKEVLETVDNSPFTARTVAKIIRSLWKRARCHPRNLAFVEDNIRAIRKNGPTESNELFDIASGKPLRPVEFNDAFYQDQKGLRRMFLTPLDIPSKPKSGLPVPITNPRSLPRGNRLSGQSPAPAKRPRVESIPVSDPLETRQIAPKSKPIPRIVWTNPPKNLESTSKSEPTFDPSCNGVNCRCNLDLSALKKIVVACRKFGLTTSPMFKTAKDALISHGIIGRSSEALNSTPKSNIDVRNHQEQPSLSDDNTNMKNIIIRMRKERDWDVKQKEIYRQVLLEQSLIYEPKKPAYQLMAEISHLAQRNKRYQDIIAFYRENTINPSNAHKVMGVLHQKLLDAQEIIQQYEFETRVLQMVQDTKKDIQNAVTVEGCRVIVNQLLMDLIQRDASHRGQTWTSKQWLAEDALLDVYEAEVLDPLQEYELIKWDVPWEEHAYECSDCHLKLESQANLDDHRILHCVSLNRCHVCILKVSPQEMDEHLKDHAQNHDLNSPLTCKECQVQVPNLKAMQTHVKEHNPQQNFCVCCGKRFHADKMAQHWLTKMRKGKKPICSQIVCPYCGKMASPNPGVHLCATVTKIMMIDDQIVRFYCPECGKKFLKRNHYNSHMGLVHGQGIEVCDICYRSVLKGKFKDHIITHTLIRPYKCPKCDTTAQSKAVIWTHLKGVHGEKKPDNGTIEVIPEEYEKRQRFRKDIQAGIKEFIETLDHIPGKYVGKEPMSSNTRKRKRDQYQGKSLQSGPPEGDSDFSSDEDGDMSDEVDT